MNPKDREAVEWWGREIKGLTRRADELRNSGHATAALAVEGERDYQAHLRFLLLEALEKAVEWGEERINEPSSREDLRACLCPLGMVEHKPDCPIPRYQAIIKLMEVKDG